MRTLVILTVLITMTFATYAKSESKAELNQPMTKSILSGVVVDEITGETLVGVAVN
jgi:hypothetical protein